MKVHYFFLHLWAILALQVPDQDPATQINADPDPQPWNHHTHACRWATKACRRWRGRAGRRRAGPSRVRAPRSWRTGWAASGTWRGSPMRRDTGTGPGTPISGTHRYYRQCCGSGNEFFSDPDPTIQFVSDPTWMFSNIVDLNFSGEYFLTKRNVYF